MRWEAEFQINGQPFTNEIRAPLTSRLQIRAQCEELYENSELSLPIQLTENAESVPLGVFLFSAFFAGV